MRRLWWVAVWTTALLAPGGAWAQIQDAAELAGRQRAAFGMLATIVGALYLIILLLRLISRRERRGQPGEGEDDRGDH